MKNTEQTIPVWAGNYTPQRFVAFDDEEWTLTLKQANDNSYESTCLFRSTLNLDVGITPFSLIVLFDGTLVLPCTREITKARALSLFNQHLTNLLLGGVYCGEIAPEDVTRGSMNLWGYHRHGSPLGRNAKFSQSLRTHRADSDELIAFVDVKPFKATEYRNVHERGYFLSKKLPSNFAAVFLPACTSYCDEEWDRALILGWSAVELIISELWESHLILGKSVDGIGKKRRKTFLSDTRTWTASTRIEVLWQKGLINDHVYSLLDDSRSARNSFIHSVSPSTPEQARGVILANLLLIAEITKDETKPFEPEDIQSMLDRRTSIFRPPSTDPQGRLLMEPKYWRHLDPAPGFADWGDRPFEKRPAIQLRPLEKGFSDKPLQNQQPRSFPKEIDPFEH